MRCIWTFTATPSNVFVSWTHLTRANPFLTFSVITLSTSCSVAPIASLAQWNMFCHKQKSRPLLPYEAQPRAIYSPAKPKQSVCLQFTKYISVPHRMKIDISILLGERHEVLQSHVGRLLDSFQILLTVYKQSR